MLQRTLAKSVSISGKGLHTGEDVTVTLHPADVDHGIVFQRSDLYGKPTVRCHISNIATDLMRATALVDNNAKVITPEHLLSAISGMGITNVLVEMTASEVPILDGSAKHWVNLIHEAQWTEQDKEVEYLTLDKPVTITEGNKTVIAIPSDTFKITCTSADDLGRHSQHLAVTLDAETYMSDIAPSRTFVYYEDIEPLLKAGKIKGGSIDNAIVLKDDQILSKEPLRYKDELVRHKILDIIGDLALVGKPLKAHIIAVRTGHALNAKLSAAILDAVAQKEEPKAKGEGSPTKKENFVVVDPQETQMDIRRISEILPHRYPFLLVDRVVDINDEANELTAIKNVTVNEQFFQGHFPGMPVMPGVLQVEAMAQAAGLLMLRKVAREGVVAFFMSCDKVKFRQPVTPGDQLVIKVKILKMRGKSIATASGECYVGDKLVSNAELMFTLAGN